MEDGDEETGLALLRSEWQGVQKKTFTKWCNAKLVPSETVIDDLFVDLRDGKKFSLLLRNISGESPPKFERGNMRLHKVSNVSKCLDFVRRKGVKLVGVGAEEIVDGNEKMTLGMIWTIILRFALQGMGDSSMSAKDGLLLWCQSRTKDYDQVNITNFHKSWMNGLAFCALIHKHRPDLLDMDKLDPENAAENLELAFSVAQEHIGIPRLLDVDDMVDVIPDEKSVITYVSAYYQAFASSHEAQAAVKKLADNLTLFDDIERKKREFEELSSKILDWIKSTTEELRDRSIENDDFEGFKKFESELDNFRDQVKPQWEDEKNKLENAHKTLKTLHKINDLPDYVPPEELSTKVINDSWAVLEDEDRNRHKWIKDNLKRHRSIDHLYRKFVHKCNLHEAFAKETSSELSVESLIGELSYLKAAKRKYDALSTDIVSRDNRLPQIDHVYNQLGQLNFERMDEVTKRYDDLKKEWDGIKDLSKRYNKELTEKLEIAEDLDNKRAEFALKAANVNSKMEYIMDEVGDAYLVNSLDDVAQQIDQHNRLKDSIAPLEAECREVLNLEVATYKISQDKNPYTRINGEFLQRSLDDIKNMIKNKDASLDSEKVKFVEHAKLENKLKEIIKEIDDFQESTLEKLNKVDNGSLEEQKKTLLMYDNEIQNFYGPRLPKLSEMISVINEAGVDTDVVPLSTLSSKFHKLSNIISCNINLIENSILLRDASSLSEEEMREYRILFNDLDRQRVGYLTVDEFRNFLVATGHKVTPGDSNGDALFDDILSKVDPESTKTITLEGFLNYIAEKTKKKSGSEDMIEAFKVIAEGKPYITAEQLRRNLPNHAEKCIASMAEYVGEDAVPGALDYMSYTIDLCGCSDL